MFRVKKGFTLIELLVVIGVLAVVAAGVVALINPRDKILQAEDAKVTSDIGQLATALQAYAAQNQNGSYPCATAAATCPNTVAAQNGTLALGPAGSGELTAIPAHPSGAAYSYSSNPAAAGPVLAAVVSGQFRSQKYTQRCAAGTVPWWAWSSALGRSCGFCSAAATPPTTATMGAGYACPVW